MSTELQQVSVDNQEAATAAKGDFNFFAALCMGADYLFPFPPFYIALFSLLTSFSKKVERYAIGIPRGFAKTTFVKLLCVWYILFSHKEFILVVAASERKAAAIIADIIDFLSTPNIRRVFGHWDRRIEKDDQITKIFHFRGRDIILWAAGARSSVRGIVRKNQRPDVMLMDDIQDKEEAKNPELADALHVWMLGTLMKARAFTGCTYIYLGNMYPQNSILEKLKNDKFWTSLIVGGIIQNTETGEAESLWEDLKPIEELLEEYEVDTAAGHPEVFLSEILNSTDVALASGIDISKLPNCPEYLLAAYPGEGGMILIDPSSGKKGKDDCAIHHVEVIDGLPIVDAVIFGTFSPLETIKQAIALGLERNTRCIGVESVAYQSTLLFWFNHYCNDQGISGFEFIELPPKGQAKNDRIKRWVTRWMAKEMYIHPSVKSLVISQLVDWNPLKTNNKDDVIDPPGYIEYVLKECPELVTREVFNTDPINEVQAASSESLQLPF